MKHGRDVVQHDGDARPGSFVDRPTKRPKQGFDVAPPEAGRRGISEDYPQGSPVLSIHPDMILELVS
jgi:hypothetical protein